MYESDIKIFELIGVLKELKQIKSENQFCIKIGFLRQNLNRVKEGKAHFTAQHIEMICKTYNINSNWIFNIEKNMYINSKTSTKAKSLDKSMLTTPNN